MDKTLSCMEVVYDSITERFFNTLGPWTKLLKRFLLSFRKLYSIHNTLCWLFHLE